MNYIKEKIKSWWAYSRTIFVNVGGALLMLANEILPPLVGIDYDAFFKHEVSVLIGLVINVLNVWLRILTVGPVGMKPVAPVEPSEMPSPKAD